jgi:hypothetical protein
MQFVKRRKKQNFDWPYLPSLLYTLLCGITWQLGSDNTGQSNSLGANDLTVDASDGLWTVNQDSLAIDNVDNSGKLASIRTVVDKDDTANFDELCEWLFNTEGN